ncbi:MAG TPA: LacI family DNA-binding transcriptional regulator, partial [Devosia sp.]|nr:LacI family DNA-binding transcriptional regulator [Devosia sp.]
MSTISKVAARAGVSRTTVSHVLNHADRVSQALREKVMLAIDKLGYVPNPQAQSLRTGRTNIIAMLIPDIRNPFYPELVKTAQSELEAEGLDMLIFNTDVPGGHSQDH